jgi:hypothetical protein
LFAVEAMKDKKERQESDDGSWSLFLSGPSMFLLPFKVMSPTYLSRRAASDVKTKGSLYRRRACSVLRSFSYVKQGWGFFHFLEIVTGLAGTFHWSEDPSTALAGTFHRRRSSRLLKTGFFTQVRELKIQRKKKSRQCFMDLRIVISMYFPPTKSKTKVHKNYYYYNNNNNNKEPQQHCNTTLHVPKT